MKKFFAIVLFFLFLLTIPTQTNAEGLQKLGITKYPEEFEIEKGWTGVFTVDVKNSGEIDLPSVILRIEGINASWFKLPDEFDLKAGENKTLDVKFTIPVTTTSGNYRGKVVVSYLEARDEKSFVLRVFASDAERIFYQLQFLRDKLTELENRTAKSEKEGNDTQSVRALLKKAEDKVNLAESYIGYGKYGDASDVLIMAKDYLVKAEQELQVAQPVKRPFTLVPTTQIWFGIILIALVVVAVAILSVVKNRRHEMKIGLHTSILKKAVVGQLTGQRLEKEREKIEKMLSILEKQYTQGIISKESYEELKSKSEQRLAEIERKLKE